MCLSGEPGDRRLEVAMGRVYVTGTPACNCEKLRAALAGLVGEDDVETLKQMAEFTEMHAPASTDKAAMLTALAVLIEVRP